FIVSSPHLRWIITLHFFLRATTKLITLSLHDALPIYARGVLDSEIGDELLSRFEAHGIKGLAWADNGFRHMTNNVRPITSPDDLDRKSTRLNSSHVKTSYAVFCLKKKIRHMKKTRPVY